MAKTVVVVKDGIKKTVPEEYKKDFIVAGWKEEGVATQKAVDPSKAPYNYKSNI